MVDSNHSNLLIQHAALTIQLWLQNGMRKNDLETVHDSGVGGEEIRREIFSRNAWFMDIGTSGRQKASGNPPRMFL